jgi:hypothetical protein
VQGGSFGSLKVRKKHLNVYLLRKIQTNEKVAKIFNGKTKLEYSKSRQKKIRIKQSNADVDSDLPRPIADEPTSGLFIMRKRDSAIHCVMGRAS